MERDSSVKRGRVYRRVDKPLGMVSVQQEYEGLGIRNLTSIPTGSASLDADTALTFGTEVIDYSDQRYWSPKVTPLNTGNKHI